MIVSLHVATGAVAGALGRSRGRAVALGLLAHALGDRLPHQDIASRRFEIGSGIFGVLLVASRRGIFEPATVGAVAASSPDLEHVLPFLRVRGRKLFPSHRIHGWHRAGGVPAWAQLLVAGALLGGLAALARD